MSEFRNYPANPAPQGRPTKPLAFRPGGPTKPLAFRPGGAAVGSQGRKPLENRPVNPMASPGGAAGSPGPTSAAPSGLSITDATFRTRGYRPWLPTTAPPGRNTAAGSPRPPLRGGTPPLAHHDRPPGRNTAAGFTTAAREGRTPAVPSRDREGAVSFTRSLTVAARTEVPHF